MQSNALFKPEVKVWLRWQVVDISGHIIFDISNLRALVGCRDGFASRNSGLDGQNFLANCSTSFCGWMNLGVVSTFGRFRGCAFGSFDDGVAFPS